MDDSLSLPAGLAALIQDLPLEDLAFAPVPVKARHDGWTAERQRGFVLRLALLGCVSSAARAVGKSRESAYRLREHSGAAGFAAAWDKAQGWGRERASDLGLERAILGETRDVYYRGRKIGQQVRYDNRLLLSAMKAHAVPNGPAGRDEVEELNRLLDEIDPVAAWTLL
jgi:hypothetical protein